MRNREIIREMRLINIYDEVCGSVVVGDCNIKIEQQNSLGTITLTLDMAEQQSLYKCLQILLENQ